MKTMKPLLAEDLAREYVLDRLMLKVRETYECFFAGQGDSPSCDVGFDRRLTDHVTETMAAFKQDPMYAADSERKESFYEKNLLVIPREIDGFVFTDSDIAKKGLEGTLTVGEWLDLDRVTGF